MTKQLLFSFTLLFLFLFQYSNTTSAQSPAQAPTATAAAPAPAAPASKIDIIKILNAAGHFTLLARLLKSTQVGDQINRQLKGSNQRLTLFAPGDGAFSSLQKGTLNSLTDGQQVQLLLYHLLPTFLSTSQFQTVSNPLRTEAGDTGPSDFPLNLTTNANNQANVSTGVVNATIAQTLYADNQLAVYEVDKVLLPMSIFGSASPAPSPAPTPAPAPAPAKPKKTPKAKPVSLAPEPEPEKSKPKAKPPPAASLTPTTPTTTSSDDTSGAVGLTCWHGVIYMVCIGVAAFCM